MSDLITISHSDLEQIIATTVVKTLREIGVKAKDANPWITQNQAHKLIGRTKVEKAMRKGLIQYHSDNPGSRYGRIMLLRKDVEKLITK